MTREPPFPRTAESKESLDPDWAPQLPSIWDAPEDDGGHDVGGDFGDHGEGPEFGSGATPGDPPWPVVSAGPDWLAPADWARAEKITGRALADAMGAVVRLDERLLSMDPDLRAGARLRLALQAVPDLIWAEGARLRPEHLALADAGRIGGGDEAPVLARAAWAVRRMSTGPGLALPARDPDAVRAFLGFGARDGQASGVDTPEPDLGGVGRDVSGLLETRRVDKAALEEWCAAVTALSDVHSLTRAVAGGALWTGLGVTDAVRILDPALVMGSLGAAAGQGGFCALPILPPRGAHRIAAGGAAAERLAAGLARITEGARSALMLLDRVAAWQARAAEATAGLKGRAPAALIALLAARPVVSARDAATRLDLTDRHARRLIDTFANRRLARELTGHTRFRFWAARI